MSMICTDPHVIRDGHILVWFPGYTQLDVCNLTLVNCMAVSAVRVRTDGEVAGVHCAFAPVVEGQFTIQEKTDAGPVGPRLIRWLDRQPGVRLNAAGDGIEV